MMAVIAKSIAERLPSLDVRQPSVLAAVVLFHVAVLWLLAQSITIHPMPAGQVREIQVALLGENAPIVQSNAPPVPDMQTPVAPNDTQPPTIEVEGEPVASTVNGATPILPPAPDSTYRNVDPVLPRAVAKSGTSFETTLSVLVDATGAIADARLMRSSGERVLDDLASLFAKTHWRFRPALQNGRPVADWTTIVVRFAQPS